jgi:hypothetical protein
MMSWMSRPQAGSSWARRISPRTGGARRPVGRHRTAPGRRAPAGSARW